MSEQLTLGYFHSRGRAQIVRHLLSHLGLDFAQHIYKTREEYNKDKPNLGPFPNLPYLRHGDFVFSETLAICRYLVRLAGQEQLLGRGAEDEAKVDNFYYAFMELIEPLVELLFNKKFNDVKVGHYYKIKSQLERFDKYAQGKDTIIGYLTIADFYVAEFVYYIEKIYPEEVNNYRNLITVRDYVMGLPGVQQYYARENAVQTPFLNPAITAVPFYWPGTEPKSVGSAFKGFTKKQQPLEQKPIQSQPSQSTNQPQQNWNQQVSYYYPSRTYKLCVISGSLSADSSINYLLTSILGLGHPALQFQWCDISSLQLHNQDIDEAGTDNANSLRGQVYEAAAVLIGVADTHGTLSAALVNSYNWLVPVLKDKIVGVVGVEGNEGHLVSACQREGIATVGMQVGDLGVFFNEEGALQEWSQNKVKDFYNRVVKQLEASGL